MAEVTEVVVQRPLVSTRTPVSVIVPAHDEARVIGRCLDRLLDGAEPDEVEIVVVCNGCTDGTAEVASRTAPDATVVELAVASKHAALNEGDRIAHRFPRFYVDADVELDIEALRTTADMLAAGDALCAAPAPRFDTDACPWYIRQFFRVFERMPFLSGAGVVGTGVYALSAEGRARFDEFPAITADDQFVMDRFEVGERRTVRSATFVVHPPRTLGNLLKTRRRTYRGNRELRRTCTPAEAPDSHNGRALARLFAQRDTRWSVPVYVAISVAAKTRAARAPAEVEWERDVSTR